jgi:hypothetical protein
VTDFAMCLAAALGIARNLLAAGLIIAGVGAGALAADQDEAVPTFGTTVVVPGGLLGVIYDISPFSKSLPYFPSLDPLGVIYTSTLNVTPRDFREGFPGVTDRFEWFAIDYSGRFWIEKPGLYRFELTSDDGSKLYIDDELVVNNDGIHPPETRTGELMLAGGIHRIRVSYFQGPRDEVALVLRVARPGEEWRIFSTEEFKPPSDPATWMYLGQVFRVSSVTSAPGEKVSLEISLDSAKASAPTTLKWEVVFPAQLLELEGDGPEIGSAAMDSGKSLTCSRRKSYSDFCTLSGGQNPVANGPIAIFHFKIRAAAEAGTAAVRIERAEAVTVDSKELTLNNAEGTVTIRQR